MAFTKKTKEEVPMTDTAPAPFDQDTASPAEIVSPAHLPAELGEYTPRSEVEGQFLALLADQEWIDTEEAGLRMALQIATGDPAKAGESMETRSVKNLKLANKRHLVTGFALSLSSFYQPENASSCPVYAVVEAVDADGSPFSYSIGSWKPLGQLVAKKRGNLLPWSTLIAEVPSKNGNPAYSYVDA